MALAQRPSRTSQQAPHSLVSTHSEAPGRVLCVCLKHAIDGGSVTGEITKPSLLTSSVRTGLLERKSENV